MMKNKSVLIVAYYWPPAGGPGVQRWLKFVKYFRTFFIEPIVYVPQNPSYPIVDLELENEIPKGITILKQPIAEPYKFASFFSKQKSKTISSGIISASTKQSLIERILLYIRGNFFIPDARKNWVKPSVKYLKKYIKAHNIKTVITTGPPHSMHLIGLKLKQDLNINWVADFRDPWTTIGYHKKLKLNSSSKAKHKALESKVLNTADQIVVTSPTTKLEFEDLTPQPIKVITNGFDDEGVVNTQLDKDFSISHIGSLLSERNPQVLWQVLIDLIRDNELFKDKFKLNLVGAVSEDVKLSIRRHNLDEFVNYTGYVSHQDALMYQRQSQVLLLIEINTKDTQCIIPGKVFEYMISHRPILAIGPKNWDVKPIITETQTGSCFGYNDYELIKLTILKHFNIYLKNQLKTSPVNLNLYSRRSLTASLSKLLHSL